MNELSEICLASDEAPDVTRVCCDHGPGFALEMNELSRICWKPNASYSCFDPGGLSRDW